jgi:chemotaxis-related protein WspB
MLALAFHIGPDRFALACADVVEVVPHVALRAVPRAPATVAGTFTYRGAVVPVIDLCLLVAGVACPARLSSRIMVVRFEPQSGDQRLLGLLAERVIDTIMLDAGTAVPTGIQVPDAPYLGEVYFEAGATVQLLRVERLVHGPLHGLVLGGVVTP